MYNNYNIYFKYFFFLFSTYLNPHHPVLPMMGASPPETLVCAKRLEEEKIQFKQNLTSLNNCTIRDQQGIKVNFQKLELFPSNYSTPSKNTNRPFATSDHVVQNPPCWRASSLLFPHWDIKTKSPESVKLDLPLF